DAHNVSILHHNFGMEPEDIASKVYSRRNAAGQPDVKWVEDMIVLADLTPEAVEAMKAGRLKVPQALKLAAMAKNAQKSLLKAQEGEKKIRVRSNADADAPAKTKKIGTTAIRDFWKPYAERTDNRPMTRFAKAQSEWLKSGDTEVFFRAVAEIL